MLVGGGGGGGEECIDRVKGLSSSSGFDEKSNVAVCQTGFVIA